MTADQAGDSPLPQPVAPPAPMEPAAAGPGAIATIDPPPQPVATVPDDPRTGEPRVPWVVRIASALSFLAVANVAGAVLVVYWDAVDRFAFAKASWLMGQFETEPGSLGRVLLAVAVTVITLLVAIPQAITGHYAWTGYRWTRISALIGAALSVGVLTLNQWAWPTIAFAALAAGLLWTPPADRFFRTWQARRHPGQHFSPPTTDVYYGPLPRYR